MAFKIDNTFLIIITVIVGYILYMKFSSTEQLDNVSLGNNASPLIIPTLPPITQQSNIISSGISVPSNSMNDMYSNVTQPPTNIVDKIVAGTTQLTAEELLPKYDEASDFAKENPVSDLLKEQQFLVSGYHMGINTVMQSNKIPYYDLRSAPPIPRQIVGPWNQSSYESFGGSSARRQFELGSS